MKRASGLLLPISSLPSPYGIGSFSREAYEFVDQLAEAGQSYWQILPLGPTGYGDSPYQAFSTFAGSPYLIDLDALVEEGLLTREERDQIEQTLKDYHLPIRAAGLAPEEVLKTTKLDKKMEAGKIKFVLLKKLGEAFVARDVEDKELLEAICYVSEENRNE